MKYIPLNDEIYRYTSALRSPRSIDAVLDELAQETQTLGSVARMQIGRDQSSLFSLLVAATGAQRAIEIGTFTGSSALAIAHGLPENGKLLCLDQSEEWTQIARKYWEKAGYDSKIELRIGDAKSTLAALPEEEQFDFAFVDADKTGYDTYFELLLPRLKPNSLIIFDNMLRGGRVVQANLVDESERAIDAMNKKLASDERVESVLLPLADGLNICRKR